MKPVVCFAAVLFLCQGCSTSFGPIPNVEVYGTSCISYTRQGSVPASSVYREVWPVSPVVCATNEPEAKPRIFEIPVIGSIVSAAASVYRAVSGGQNDKAYRWREDFFISSTNLTYDQAVKLVDRLNRPMFDGQRDGWLPAGSVKGEKR